MNIKFKDQIIRASFTQLLYISIKEYIHFTIFKFRVYDFKTILLFSLSISLIIFSSGLGRYLGLWLILIDILFENPLLNIKKIERNRSDSDYGLHIQFPDEDHENISYYITFKDRKIYKTSQVPPIYTLARINLVKNTIIRKKLFTSYCTFFGYEKINF